MHKRLSLILLAIGIVASLSVANTYLNKGAHNDGFNSQDPDVADQTLRMVETRKAAARTAAARNFRAGNSGRDWTDLLGRYAPWMADFEISAVNDAAGKEGVDVSDMLRHNARPYSGNKPYRAADVSGLRGAGGDNNALSSSGSKSSTLGGYGSTSGKKYRPGQSYIPGLSQPSETDNGSVPYETVPYETVLAENSTGETRDPSDNLTDPRTKYLDIPASKEKDDTVPYIVPDPEVPTNPGDVDVSPLPNPEPGTLLLGAMGLGALAARRRKART